MYRKLTHTRPVTAGRPEEKNKSSHHGIITIMRKRAQKHALGKQITKNSRLQNPLIHFLWKFEDKFEKCEDTCCELTDFKNSQMSYNKKPLASSLQTLWKGAFTKNKRGKQMVLTNFATFREGLLRSPKSSLSTTPKQAIAAFNLTFVSRIRALIVKDQFP